MKDCLPRIPTAVFTLGSMMMCPTLGFGSVIVSLNNEGSATLHEIEVVPGGTFSVDVNLDATGFSRTVGLWFKLRASERDRFDIVHVTDHSPWDSTDGPSELGGLDPEATMASRITSLEPFGPGMSTLATLELAVRENAPQATYSLDITYIEYYEDFSTPAFGLGIPGPSFIVHVIPEPSSSVLAFGAVLIPFRARTAKEKQP